MVNVGDKVTLRYGNVVTTRLVTRVEANSLWLDKKIEFNFVLGEVVGTERALPTTPGTVLRATVRGVPDVLVMRQEPFHDQDDWVWVSATHLGANTYHSHEDITDWTVVYTPGEEN